MSRIPLLFALCLCVTSALPGRCEDDPVLTEAGRHPNINWGVTRYTSDESPGHYSISGIPEAFWPYLQNTRHIDMFAWGKMSKEEQVQLIDKESPAARRLDKEVKGATDGLRTEIERSHSESPAAADRTLDAAVKRATEQARTLSASLGNDYLYDLYGQMRRGQRERGEAATSKAKTQLAARSRTGSMKTASTAAGRLGRGNDRAALAETYDGSLGRAPVTGVSASAYHPSGHAAGGVMRVDVSDHYGSMAEEKAPPAIAKAPDNGWTHKAATAGAAAGALALGVVTLGFLWPSSTDKDIGEH